MKTKVRVKLVAETEVEIETEHAEDESPTDLNDEEQARALRLGSLVDTNWDIDWSNIQVVK